MDKAIRAVLIIIALAAAGILVVHLQPRSVEEPRHVEEQPAAASGDTVDIDYVLFAENGSVYDTSIESVARASGIYKEGLSYKPLRFKVGDGSVIKGVEKAVLGMHVGEERNVSIPPEEAYGEYKPELLAVMPRFYVVERLEVVPLQNFLSVFPDFDFSADKTVSMGSWTAAVLAVSNESVTLRYAPEPNASIQTESWVETVVGVNDSYITLRRDPAVGRQYLLRNAEGKLAIATVRDVKDDYLLLDFNPPLAGQTINFTIKLVNLTR